MQTHTLDVPGATITYDVRGGLADTTPERPVLMMVGSPMQAWTYHRIEPASLLGFDLAFTDATGAAIEPPPGVPSAVRHVVSLTQVAGGRTSMTITEYGYGSQQVRDQSQAGLEQCLDKMGTLLQNDAR